MNIPDRIHDHIAINTRMLLNEDKTQIVYFRPAGSADSVVHAL